MASQKIIFNLFVVIFALCVLRVFSSPIPDDEAVSVAVDESDSDALREAKFYGGSSQASALAAASSGGIGGFGYPGYGYGGGVANSFAAADANSFGGGGYPYGK